MIPIVIGAFGTIPKKLVNRLEDFEIDPCQYIAFCVKHYYQILSPIMIFLIGLFFGVLWDINL